MANTNYAIKLYKTSDSAKRVGINVTNSTDTTDYALYVNGNTKIAGDAEITNSLTVNDLTISDTGFINSSNINVDKKNNYSDPGNIWFIVGDSSSREGGGLISISEQTSSNKKVPSTLNFYIRSYSNGTISNYGEHYSLPVVNSGLSSTQYYNILTSKNAVTVAQGGTGRTTLTSNAILTGNGTSSIKMVATAKGAAYATSANGALTFGTLPIAQGGTGSTTAANARSNLGITPTNIGAATSGHIHGYITNSGTIDEDPISIANNDRIVVLDADDNYSLVDSGITFDGSTATKCLTQKGTWETFIKGSGTSGYLAKWNGGSSITNGPQLGSDIAKYLSQEGTWKDLNDLGSVYFYPHVVVPANGSVALPTNISNYGGGIGYGFCQNIGGVVFGFSVNAGGISITFGPDIRAAVNFYINNGNLILVDYTGAPNYFGFLMTGN